MFIIMATSIKSSFTFDRCFFRCSTPELCMKKSFDVLEGSLERLKHILCPGSTVMIDLDKRFLYVQILYLSVNVPKCGKVEWS